MCECGGCLQECPVCADWCCPYCGCATDEVIAGDDDLDDES